MVEGKYVAGAIAVLGAGVAAVLVLMKLSEEAKQKPVTPISTTYVTQIGKTAERLCAEKGWVWENGQCVEPSASSSTAQSGSGEGSKTDGDKTGSDDLGPKSYECCTGGGIVSNPKYCPGGNVKPECPGEEVRCPDYYTLSGTPGSAPIKNVGPSLPAGSTCPTYDCGFSSSFTSRFGKVYGRTGKTCPGKSLTMQTSAIQHNELITGGSNEYLLDPGKCPDCVDRASKAGGLPKVRIYGPICVKVTQESRKLTRNWSGGIDCGSYGIDTSGVVCIGPEESQDFIPRVAWVPGQVAGNTGKLYRLRINLVQPGSCMCESSGE